MLRLPNEGFCYSVEKHNGDLDALVEWIEGSIVFADDRLTRTDVVDILLEDEVYNEQDFAEEWVESAWLELARRRRVMGPFCPYQTSHRRIERTSDWQQTTAFSFCLMLALQVRYRAELAALSDYNQQGVLFEQLTSSALQQVGLRTHLTAWSKEKSMPFHSKVAALAEHLGEPVRDGAIDRWAADGAKDGGLDIVCSLPFADGWSGRPIYLVQCASGQNWKEKRATPDVNLWSKLIDFTTSPQRGLAMPFALLEDQFRQAANYELLALFLDRHRLSAVPTSTPDSWPEDELRKNLIRWIEPRAESLPYSG